MAETLAGHSGKVLQAITPGDGQAMDVHVTSKELGLTQIQLAEQLGISQQLIAAYEAGARKIPASMLPTLAKLFAVPLEELVGMEKRPAKRGPASVLQRQIEQIGQMPRAKQKFITEMLEALIRQQKAS